MLLRERFDYTAWQREYFKDMPLDEIGEQRRDEYERNGNERGAALAVELQKQRAHIPYELPETAYQPAGKKSERAAKQHAAVRHTVLDEPEVFLVLGFFGFRQLSVRFCHSDTPDLFVPLQYVQEIFFYKANAVNYIYILAREQKTNIWFLT